MGVLFAFSLCDNNPHGNGGGGAQDAGRRGQHCTGEIRSVRTAGLCASFESYQYTYHGIATCTQLYMTPLEV